MRNRTVGINVRVTEKEKKIITKNAKKSGLSTSSFLRKCGLKQKIFPAIDEDIRNIYDKLIDLKCVLDVESLEEIKEKIVGLQSDLLDLMNYKKAGDEDGNN